jgi:hypothetical protein
MTKLIHGLKYFDIRELVPPNVYKKRGDKSIELFDANALKLIDWLRERYGPATVNNWHLGGKRTQSGLRTFIFYKVFARFLKSFSQHKYGRAFDIIFKNISAEGVRQDLAKNWKKEGLGFSITVENGVSWLHIDTRPQPRYFNSFWP